MLLSWGGSLRRRTGAQRARARGWSAPRWPGGCRQPAQEAPGLAQAGGGDGGRGGVVWSRARLGPPVDDKWILYIDI